MSSRARRQSERKSPPNRLERTKPIVHMRIDRRFPGTTMEYTVYTVIYKDDKGCSCNITMLYNFERAVKIAFEMAAMYKCHVKQIWE